MKKEVGTVCISTTPSSLYVGYPKTTVPIYLVPTHGRSGTLFLLLQYCITTNCWPSLYGVQYYTVHLSPYI